MEEIRSGAKEKKDWYCYVDYPKNIRQIGIPLSGKKIYLEDYVVTYLKQCFAGTSESKAAVLLGRRGEDEARDGIFIYGAVVLEEEDILSDASISPGTWDHIHRQIHEHFSGAKILGWACGVNVWNSQIDSRVKKLHQKEFGEDGQVLYLWDLAEKEEKMFLWRKKLLKEVAGYYIYFEKNPQMQDFMLGGMKPERTGEVYEDRVTKSMRRVMVEKEEHRRNLQLLTYCGIVAAGIAVIFGVHMVFDSTSRIQKMEQTVNTLSNYVQKQQEDVEAMSRKTDYAVKQIPFESQAAETKTPKATQKPKKQKNTPAPQAKQPKTAPAAEQASTNAKRRAQSYVVQKGDTLSQIVWRQYHDLSYEKKVKKANGLKNADEIYAGQRLILPKYKKD